MEKTERKRLAILRLLKDSEEPLSSLHIARQLSAQGHEMSERSARYYLTALDKDGLARNFGKRGRLITQKGLEELSTAYVFEKVGYLAARIDQMTYLMDFDLSTRQGTVVVNISIVASESLPMAIPLMQKVFQAGYAMGDLLTLFASGERIGDTIIPENCMGIGTVCSVSLNGILLANGIPTNSRFGGLLELRNGNPTRLVELIHYAGTTIDPLEVFIGNRMTDYTGATTKGDGKIGVSFREMPVDSRNKVLEISKALQAAGLNCIFRVGWPGQPLLDIPVSEGRYGALIIGGMNPVAILVEQDIRVQSRALAALVPFSRLFHYSELVDRYNGLI